MNAQRPEVDLHGVLASLVSAGVDFVVCGGVACVIHGVDRSTADLDCAVRLDDENLAALVAALKPLGYRLRAPEPIEALADARRRRAWIAEKDAVAATLVHDRSPLQVDVFLRYPVPYDQLRRDAPTADLGGTRVLVSSIRHLMTAKESIERKRPVDRRDLEDLAALLRDRDDGSR